METTLLQFDCRITAHTAEELEKELQAIRSRGLTMLGASRTTTSATSHGTPPRARTRTTRTRTRSAPQRLRGSARARTGNGHVTDEQMLSAIEGKDGISGKQLAAELGISPETALRKLKTWEKQRKAFRQGERAQTRWFARQPAMVT